MQPEGSRQKQFRSNDNNESTNHFVLGEELGWNPLQQTRNKIKGMVKTLPLGSCHASDVAFTNLR